MQKEFLMSKEEGRIVIKKEVRDLKKNPVFNMSLSGKELFHSNMLAMFLQDKDTDTEEPSNLAFALMELFKPKLSPKEEIKKYRVFDVQREKGNRDLIIIYIKKENLDKLTKIFNNYDLDISGIDDLSDETFNSIEKWNLNYADTKNLHDILNSFNYVVIENKFKSYPYIEQLEKYNKAISIIPNLPIYKNINDEKPKNKKGITKLTANNTEYYLFAPKMTLDLFCEKDGEKYSKTVESIKWRGISYDEDYLNGLGRTNLHDDFLNNFKKYYREYTKDILAICNKTINDDILRNNHFFFSLEQSSQLKNGRIHDICQKILSNCLLNKLKKEIQFFTTYEEKNNLISGTGYEHQLGFWDFRFMNPNSENPIYHGIQIQGSSFGLFVVAMYEKIRKTDKKKKNNLAKIFESSENQDKVQKWIEARFIEIQKEFNKISEHKITQPKPLYNKKTGNLFGYTVDGKYCHRYGIIDLNDLAENGDFRNIDYSTVKTLLEVSLKVLSKTSFSLE